MSRMSFPGLTYELLNQILLMSIVNFVTNFLVVFRTGVGSAELNVNLNLHKVAEKCTNVEFKQSELYDRPLIMRLKNPRSIALVYDTGKLIVIGTKSYDEFRTAARRFARMIQKTGVDVHLTSLKMHFYIGLSILPFDINVKAMRNHEYFSKFIM